MRFLVGSFVVGLLLVLLTPLAAAERVQNAPIACTGQWINCGNAFDNGGEPALAAASDISSKSGQWGNYGFSLADNATVSRVVVRADFSASRPSGFIDVQVSGDGGRTFGPAHRVGGNTGETSFFIDVSADFAWTPAMLDNANLRVQATCVKDGSGANPRCRLDWLPVRVSYSPAFDFSLSADPGSDRIVQGNTSTTAITVQLLSGTPQLVNLSHTGCPPNATCRFSPSSGTPTYSSNFTVATGNTTPASTYTITITGTGGGLTRITNYYLTVNQGCLRSNPTINITPPLRTAPAGTPLAYDVKVTNNDHPACGSSTFSLGSIIPSGWTAFFGFFPNPIAPGSTNGAGFIITSSPFASPGNYTFNVSATNANAPLFFATSSAIYQVNSTPFNFSLSLAPNSTSVVPGNTTKTVVTVQLTGGTAQTVNLSHAGCPPNATCAFTPSSGLPTYFSNFTVNTTAATPLGLYRINLTGTSASLTKFITFNLTVNATNQTNQTFNFNVSVNPATGSVIQGNAAQATAVVTLLNGTPQIVNLSQQGCPPNATCTFSPSSGTPTYSSTFKVNTTNTTPVGIYKINITGTGGGLTRTTTYTLQVNATNQTNQSFDFSLSVNPTSGSMTQVETINTTVTVSLVSGTTQPVNLSSANCPPFSFCVFAPAAGNPSYQSTFSVASTALTPVGTYPITITGSGGGVIKNTTYTVTVGCVRSNPGLSLTPPVQTAPAGSTLVYTLNVTNNDSVLCGSSIFNLTSTIPSNWTAVFNITPPLIAPGSSKLVAFSLTSSLSSPPGNYTFKTAATNSKAGEFATNASAIYQINFTPPFGFSIATKPSNGSVVRGNTAQTITNVSLLTGVPQPVNLSAAGCPPFSFCVFAPPSGTPSYFSNLTVATSTLTPLGSYVITISGTGGGLTKNTTYTLNVTQ